MAARVSHDPRRSYDRGAWTEDAGAADEPGDPRGGHGARGPVDLSKLSTAEIVTELRRREGRLTRLVERRGRLAEQLARIEAEIRELEESAPVAPQAPVRRGPARVRLALPRPKNSLSLADAIAAEIEEDETVGPADAARRVLRNGYQTIAKNFTLLVNGTLRKDDRFERVGRGAYRRLADSEVRARRDG
jgi:hypothetical protein